MRMTAPHRLRVAMLGQYPPDPERVEGGVEATLETLCAEMTRRPDVELHLLFSTALEGSHRHAPPPGLTVHCFPRHRWGRPTFYRRDARALARRLCQIEPDIVHAHGTGHYAAAALAAGRQATVITAHGIIFREARFALRTRERVGWWMQAFWERRILRRVRHIIAISPYVEYELGRRTNAAFHPIENPVSEAFFSLPSPSRGARVLWVGRLIPRKDPQTALRAFAEVKSACPDAELHIVGESDSCPGYAGKTRELGAALGLTSSIRWLGELGRTAVLEQYRRCGLVLLSSVQETAPVTIAQAMAAGRPVVTTAAGGCRHMVTHGETGLVAGVGDATALAVAMKGLIQDQALSTRVADAARLEAETRFRPRIVVDRTLDLYRRLEQWRPPSPPGATC
ncbi:MAG: glycosyltransferase family 4 protein [Acidobacteriota bacterium]